MNNVYIKVIGVITIALFIFGFSKSVQASVKDTAFRDVVVASDACTSVFGDPGNKEYPAYWFQWILNVMKYVAIFALLVFTTIDFVKALIASDKDALKKAGGTAAKRFIYCVLIFFLPIIVDFFMTLVGAYGTCGIS